MVRSHQKFGGILLMLAVGWLAIAPGATVGQSTQPSASQEYQIKAACLLNFAQFIEWPATAFSGADAPIVVGVLGDDPFGSTLDQTFQGEMIQGRKIQIKRSRQIEDLKSCNLLFISKSERDHTGEILEAVKDKSIVTVGETDRLAERGGIINFYLNNNKIRFEINAGAAEEKKLKINSQLLKRARIVSTDKSKGKD